MFDGDEIIQRKRRIGMRDDKPITWKCRLKRCNKEKRAEKAPLCPNCQCRMVPK